MPSRLDALLRLAARALARVSYRRGLSGAARAPRVGVGLLGAAVLQGALGAGCGRSSLDDGPFVGGSGESGSSSGSSSGASASGSTGSSGSFSGAGGSASGSSGSASGSSGSASGSSGSGCNGATCPNGCCAGGACLDGTAPNACGSKGVSCQSCPTLGANWTCDVAAHACAAVGATCGPSSCGGCCVDTICNVGSDHAACGSGGAACQDCGALATCAATGAAFQCGAPPPPPTCSAANCVGCCDASGACQGGFVDAACGQNGAACADCTGLAPASTCAGAVIPRVCASQQSQCPAPYAGCPSGLMATPLEKRSGTCSSADLQNAASACSAGAHSAECSAFFQFEQTESSKCAACLSPFDFDFEELTGELACLSSFVDPACNQSLACATNCEDSTCAMCPDAASKVQCRTRAATDACAGVIANAGCAVDASLGGGSVCDPMQYPDFGQWFAAVGTEYCAL